METMAVTCDVCAAPIVTTRLGPAASTSDRAAPLDVTVTIAEPDGAELRYHACSAGCLRRLADLLDAGVPPV